MAIKNDESNINIIYILGTSFSGSTLLGFVLGSSQQVLDVGELTNFNYFQNSGGRFCSCGKNSFKCEFWSDLYARNYKIFGGFSKLNKLKIALKVFFGKSFPQNLILNSQEKGFFQSLIQQAFPIDSNNTNYILDDSKNLWRLICLMRLKNIKIKVINLKRDINGNVSSFVKHKRGFWKGIFIYKTQNFLIKRFQKKNDLDYFNLNYEDLCTNTDFQLESLGKFLKIDYADYKEQIKKKKYHVASGNKGTKVQFFENFSGFKYDDSWKNRLNRFQKIVLKIFGNKR